MLTNVKKNKSLTFYQPTYVQPTMELSSAYAGGVSSATLGVATYYMASTTTGFNNQLNGFLNLFNEQRLQDIQTLDLVNPNQAARGRGVYRAWEYEKADIMMGGTGSENWTPEEQQEILKNVKIDDQKNSRSGLRGAEGHHQKNVASHPEEQANPDNIKFYKTKDEHLEKGHNGDWKNESDGPMTDKNQMLKNTNNKRVFRKELQGLGIATAIGIGVGFTIGFAVSLAQSGITPDSIKYALVEGGKSGITSGAQSLIGYGLGRTIGQVASLALEHFLSNVGIEITENISKMCSMGTVGAITIAVFSTCQFISLIVKGESLKEAAIKTGKQALFSLSLLAVSIAAQGIWGDSAGIIVSVSVGIILITYSITDTVHKRLFSEKIREYMINKSKPVFA